LLAVSCALLAVTGCANRLAFGTATKFALDVSQRPDQTVEMSLGYDRMEVVLVPTYTTKESGLEARDATADADTYSVLGTFQVSHGNPFLGQPLVIHQFFATGRAAVKAASDEGFQRLFGTAAGDIYRQGREETVGRVAPAGGTTR
jgi:hypothetical protein